MVIRILLIVVLNIVWVGIMVGTLILPTMPEFIDNPSLNSLMGSVLCEPNERLQRVQSESAGITTFCMNTTTEANREVSEKWFTGGLIATIIGFMLGTMAEVLFAFSLKRQKMTPKAASAYREVGFVQQPKPQLNINITETLRQLEEAQKAGLMTYDEYDRKRQDIFKNL
jgi:hypothetical protein